MQDCLHAKRDQKTPQKSEISLASAVLLEKERTFLSVIEFLSR